jgi:hypothetical protein
MAAVASGTLNMLSEYLISKLASPISFCTASKALYIDWLKATSLMALGITTATRNFSPAGCAPPEG